MMAATVLMVVESPAYVDMLRRLLGREARNVIVASTGDDAAGIVRREAERLDVVLIEAALSGMSGCEVCRLLKGAPGTGRIPVVAIIGPNDSASGMLEAGANGFLTSPVTEDALCAWVGAAAEISRLQRELAEKSGGRFLANGEVLSVFSTLSHAVNNPLQALYAAADTLAMEAQPGSRQEALAGEIVSQAERVAQIVAGASLRAREQADQAPEGTQ